MVRSLGTAVLPMVEPAEAGLDATRLERIYQLIEEQIADRRYPGAQKAIARRGKLVAFRTFGRARIEPDETPASDRTLWLLYSQTKIVLAATIRTLVDDGRLSFADRVADLVPGFDRHRKGGVTVFHLLSHQAGFPNATVRSPGATRPRASRSATCPTAATTTPGTTAASTTSATSSTPPSSTRDLMIRANC